MLWDYGSAKPGRRLIFFDIDILRSVETRMNETGTLRLIRRGVTRGPVPSLSSTGSPTPIVAPGELVTGETELVQRLG